MEIICFCAAGRATRLNESACSVDSFQQPPEWKQTACFHRLDSHHKLPDSSEHQYKSRTPEGRFGSFETTTWAGDSAAESGEVTGIGLPQPSEEGASKNVLRTFSRKLEPPIQIQRLSTS
jgi:hypothetical protein